MVSFVIGLEFFGIGLILVALLLLINGDGAREQKLLIFIMAGSLVQNVGYLLELIAPTVEAATTAVTVENVGSAFVPLCYCWFTYTYCYVRPPKKLLHGLGLINFFVLPTVLFNWNGLFYREVQWLSTAEGFHYVSISYGPLYILFMITRIVIPYMLSIHTLARSVRLRSDQQISRQYWTILGISSLPVVVLAAYVFKLIQVFDLTPVTLAIAMSAKYMRQVRAAVLEELNKDYVTGAKARGVRSRVILWKSVLRSSMLTIITLLALSIGSLLGGTAIIESIFMWDGVGKMAVDAITMRDYPVIQVYVIWMAVIYVCVNLFTDMIYHYLDPRIRLGREDG